MKFIGGTLAALALAATAGCGGSAASTTPAPHRAPIKATTAPAPKPRMLTLRQVTAAVCGKSHVHVNGHDELEWFTSAGATCDGDDTTIAMFDGPGARDQYAEMVADKNLILMGNNLVVWIDRFDNEARYKRAQKVIGGGITGNG